MKTTTYHFCVALLLSTHACAQSDAPELDQKSSKAGMQVPSSVVRDLIELQDGDSFVLAQRLLPTAAHEYSPEEIDDISLAAAVLVQECMTDAGHDIDLLGYTTADEARSSWDRAVHGIMFEDMGRIRSMGYAYWMPGTDDDVDPAADRLTPAEYGTLNDRFGCREHAYEELGVADRGILASGAPRSVAEFEIESFWGLKSGPSLQAERAAWSACMEEKGFADLRMDDPLPSQDRDNARAIADAECRGPSGLRDAIIAVHVQATVEAAERFADEGHDAQVARADELAAAHAVLKARGIQPLNN